MNGRFEIRQAQPGGPIELAGWAATFNQPYTVGSFTETIKPKAFARTLGENPDVSLLCNHVGMPLARTSSGTMTLREDPKGLHFIAELEPSDPDVQALVPKIKRGDLSECSFAFRCTKQEWSEDRTKRSVEECMIHRGDVSLVTTGASPSATASLRAEDLTLEQRQRIAKLIGDRVCGPYSRPDLRPASWRSAGVVRGYIEEQKLKRARAMGRRERRRVEEPEPFGPEWLIEGIMDVGPAVRKVKAGHAPGKDEAAIKQYIAERADDLGVSSLVPSGWANARSMARLT